MEIYVMLQLTDLNNNQIPYHYCDECGQQLAVSDWGLGICDACRLTPRQVARVERLTSGRDLREEAVKRLRKARDIYQRAKTYKNKVDKKKGDDD